MRAERVLSRTAKIAAGVVVAGVLAGTGILIANQSTAASPSPSPSISTTAPPSATPSDQPSTTPSSEKPSKPPLPKALWRNGDNGPAVRELEARLIQLGLLDKQYLDNSFGTMTRGAVRAFQRQHGLTELGYVDQRTWDKLTAVTHEPTRTELFPPPPKAVVDNGAKLDPRCSTGRVLCIDKTSRKLRWVVDGKVLLKTDVRFGSVRTPTREGLFTVYLKSRFHHSRLYDSDMPYAMFFSGGQAVHYSSDFAARGYAGRSHGCANIRNLTKIKWLFDQVHVGDKVVVYWS